MTRLFTVLIKALITTLIFFAVVEVGLRAAYLARNAMVRYVPLPYAFGDDYGPIPPWLDRLLILRSDDTLIWSSEPNVHRTYLDVFSPVHSEADRTALLRRFLPTLPAEFRANPTWEIGLNSLGFRGDEMSAAKPPSIVRIACIGDSWTFGMPVGQQQSYPSRLAAWLRTERPGTAYEVLNFGVLGYSSFQGLQLLKARVLDLHPDIVVIGFGMNDSEVSGYRDKDIVGAPSGDRPPALARAKSAALDAAQSLEFYKLLKYEALALRFRPKPIGDYLKAEAESKGSGAVDYEEMEPWTRVSPRDYEANIREMAGLAHARGAQVVLVDNELWEGSPYRPVLRKLADELEAPLVDGLAIVAAARKNIEDTLEASLDLAGPRGPLSPAPAGMTTVVFRAFRGNVAVPKHLSIVGDNPQLGSLVPNAVAMYDDGTHGDERAGDGVWTFTAALPGGKTAFYVYTNSGTTGQWEGLDVPHIRRVEVPVSPDGAPVYLPVETFGRVYMQGDDWHTDATGYDLIAHAVAREIALPR
jgi:hypothetical protein